VNVFVSVSRDYREEVREDPLFVKKRRKKDAIREVEAWDNRSEAIRVGHNGESAEANYRHRGHLSPSTMSLLWP
jgi:hypothetical protein